MDEIIAAIQKALGELDISEAAASKLAVGNASAIKNLRARRGEKGRNHPIENLIAVTKVLGLEFYAGKPRQIDPTIAEIDGSDYAQLPVHAAAVSAGPGAANGEAEIVDHLMFRADWLRKIGVKPAQAAVARVTGDSMAPGLQPGDLVMIDTARTDVPSYRKGRQMSKLPAFAFIQDGEARVKRLERFANDRLLGIYSDNPAHPPEILEAPDALRLRILGTVVWSGHVWASGASPAKA